MAQEWAVEARTNPALLDLVEAMARTPHEQVITLDGEPVARIVPLRRGASKQASRELIDTSALPPIADGSLERLLTRAPGTSPRSFTDAEIRDAVDLDRAEAWRAKQA